MLRSSHHDAAITFFDVKEKTTHIKQMVGVKASLFLLAVDRHILTIAMFLSGKPICSVK